MPTISEGDFRSKGWMVARWVEITSLHRHQMQLSRWWTTENFHLDSPSVHNFPRGCSTWTLLGCTIRSIYFKTNLNFFFLSTQREFFFSSHAVSENLSFSDLSFKTSHWTISNASFVCRGYITYFRHLLKGCTCICVSSVQLSND